ncbi:peptide ABC transporter substrate-binding protein [Tenggerimyces flavus]|uniref:ABC transporter substrate-binding protein n=1 Tax=Tenggerimyces flavus TaxID=1708749 RepID=A0ABV7YMN3_9ACTN|nr:ABC transporter substrate-binding protein [Tenggerimyces flavus]MBM7786180.1 peptide/nickel transport system substrate-binding protein/oligopeptide transport system substrate-binding protein [Tenggerimyces flavus]
MSLKRVGIAMLAGIAILAASACGGDAGSGDGDKQPSTFSVGGVEPDHLTPGQATGAYDQMHALFAPIVKLDEKNELTYVQAESVTSTDNTTWTIKFKPGWTFHNGESVTAQSYADAWNATAYGPNGWGNNGQLSNVVGYDKLNPEKGKPATEKLEGVKVVDETTIQVTLKGPDSQFPYRLTPSSPGWYPMPKAAFKDLKAYDEKPIGNGPFQMDGAWQHDKQIAMTSYDGYKGTKPKVDGVVFKIYSQMGTAYTDLVANNVDVIFVPQEKYRQADKDLSGRIIAFNAASIDYLGFPLWDKRFSDVRIREAISLSIDRDAVNEAIFGGLYEPAKSILSPNTIGGSTDSCAELCAFDAARAKQLLAEAGGWQGPMEIWFPGGVGYEQTFEAIANQIRQNLGIADVTVKAQPGFTQYLQALSDKSVKGPFRGHWGSLYPSAQNVLSALFTKTGEGNHTSGFYSNPDVEKLISDGNAAKSPEEAVDLYKQAEERIMQDFPVAMLFYAKYVYGYSKNVDNVRIGHDQIELTEIRLART